MLDRLAALPFWQAFAALFVIVMARSNATYWVGRGAVAGWRRYRVRARRADEASRGTAAQPGPAGGDASYLMIGIQTAVH